MIARRRAECWTVPSRPSLAGSSESIFSDIASEPVPERFVKLLEELEAKEKRR